MACLVFLHSIDHVDRSPYDLSMVQHSGATMLHIRIIACLRELENTSFFLLNESRARRV